jgi:hypothetical protein
MRNRIKVLGKRALSLFSKLTGTLFSLILVALFSKWHLGRLKRNGASRSTFIILGNGPSLSSQLDAVKQLRQNCDLLCVNEFPVSSLFEELKPEYYTQMDPEYWIKLHNKIPDMTENVLSMVARKVTWSMTMILPHEMEAIVKESKSGVLLNSRLTIRYFNRTPVKGFKLVNNLLYGLNLGMPHSQNVIVASIFFGIIMNYRKILLFGADHSWHEQLAVNKDNVVGVRQLHFAYTENERNPQDPDVGFQPIMKFNEYDKTIMESFKMHELMDAWAKVFKGYWVVKEIAADRGIKILNLTSKSYIDAFDRTET